MTTSDVSPYLLRPVRTLAEAIAEAAEQQRLAASGAVAIISTKPREAGRQPAVPSLADILTLP